MKAGPPHDSPQNERWDESDPLWRLLGDAPRREASAWFTTSTLARCRHEAHVEKESWLSHSTVVQIWRWAFAGALTVSAALALVTHIMYLNSETAANQKN